MTGKNDASKVVAELDDSAVTAALLSHGLQSLAHLMTRVGAPDAALRVEELDIPALLTLPREQAVELLTQLRDAVTVLRMGLPSLGPIDED